MSTEQTKAPVDEATRAAVARVRQEIVTLCCIGEPVPTEVTASFASPAWSKGFPGHRNFESRLVEVYWDPYDRTPHLILAIRLTRGHKWEFVFHDDHVFVVRPAGVTDWSWHHMDSNQEQELEKRLLRNEEEVAAFKIEGFCEVLTESGDEKECDRLYQQNVARPYLNTCLYRLNHGEVLVHPFFDDQLAECGADALTAMATRLEEITRWYNDKSATLTYYVPAPTPILVVEMPDLACLAETAGDIQGDDAEDWLK